MARYTSLAELFAEIDQLLITGKNTDPADLAAKVSNTEDADVRRRIGETLFDLETQIADGLGTVGTGDVNQADLDAAIQALQTALESSDATESSTRAADDNALDARITDEETARIDGDNAIIAANATALATRLESADIDTLAKINAIITDGTILDSVDEDNFASDSDTKVPTQQSVKAYVDSIVSGLTALEATDVDTFVEINALLGDATLIRVEDTDTSAFSFVVDEDDFASDLSTKVPTQQSVKAYVDASSDLETLTSYTDLRSYTGRAKVIHIDDGLRSGLFVKLPGGTDNYGTVIGDFQRVFDGPVHVDWFEIDPATPILDPGCQMSAAANVAGDGGALWFTPGKLYEMQTEFRTVHPITIYGNNSTLRRSDQVIATLTAAAAVGGTTYEVDDASGFLIGQHVTAVYGQTEFENAQSFNQIITDISGNTITVSQPHQQEVPVSSTAEVVTAFSLVTFPTGGSLTATHRVFDLNIDGNAANNDRLVSWGYQATLRAGNRKLIWDGGHIVNAPNENIFMSAGSILNVTFENLQGSFVHISAAEEFATPVEVKNVSGDGVCLKNNGHDEAFLTFSELSRDVVMANCQLKNGGMGVIGNGSTRDSDVLVTNVTAENFNAIFNHSHATVVDEDVKRLRFIDCYFKNCGDVDIRGRELQEGQAVRGVLFENTTIINGRMLIRDCAYITFNNLNVLTNENDPAFTPWTSALSAQNALVHIDECDRVDIEGGTIKGSDTQNDSIRNLLLIRTGVRLRDDAGNQQPSAYTQDVVIRNTKITNAHNGLVFLHNNATLLANSFVVNGWTFDNVQVWLLDQKTTAHAVGIEVPAGAIASNCKVYHGRVTTNNNFTGFLVRGVHGTGVGLHIGGIMRNCVVPYAPGATRTVVVGSENTAFNNHSAIVTNNLLAKAPFNPVPTFHHVSDNTIVDNTLLTTLVTPEPPLHPDYGDNAGVY